jgi:hypothetical protein
MTVSTTPKRQELEELLDWVSTCSFGASYDRCQRIATLARELLAHPSETQEREWLIWSNEHRAWWEPDRCGYTENVAEAGRYTLIEARAICTQRSWVDARHMPPETMIHEKDVACGTRGHVWVGTGDERVVCDECGVERK